MAWIDEEQRYVWDFAYSTWRQAFLQAAQLAVQYRVFVETTEQDGKWFCLTYNDIGDEPHSTACRCASYCG